MTADRIDARRPRGPSRAAAATTDPDRLRSFLEDAAHVTGHAAGLVVPTTEAEVAETLSRAATVLPIGAQSSLTGGATPQGETLLSTSGLNRILDIGRDRVRVQPGVTLAELDAALAREGRYYPPAPTFTGAFIGGTIATNAAGASTFKYGSTRQWVEALTVVLPTGDVLDLARGAVHAGSGGTFDIGTPDGTVRVPVPTYRMPAVPKISAGYFAAPGMDVIDLFIGAEGTLGVIVEATVRVLADRPAWALAFVPFGDRARALAFVAELRRIAQDTWRSGDRQNLDVSAIEYLDGRCLQVAREDGLDRKTGVGWQSRTAVALLVTIEEPGSTTPAEAFEDIARAADPGATGPLARFSRLVAEAGALDDVHIAVPGDLARLAQLTALREEIPAAINQRIGRAKETIDRAIEKTAADMIVPFERLDDLFALYDRAFAARGLDVAIWGHISDGNLHPNVIPAAAADIEEGRAAIFELGREVIRLGGSPLAEHGVGRNRVKQQLLVELYGAEGVEEMRRVKRAIDPEWKLAPGVIFSR